MSKRRPLFLIAGALALVAASGASAQTVTAEEKPAEAGATPVVKLQTFEIMESRLLNMDIARSENDPQPYIIMGKTELQTSGAPDLEDFFKNRLQMNTAAGTNNRNQNFNGHASTINLYGLGAANTLILIDGHRLADFNSRGAVAQPNVNAIPLGAIERVEVLPTTASGIYGGSATGGVINIILRRDYEGAEIVGSYGDTFDGKASNKRFDFSTGLTLEGGKTYVLLAASWAKSDPLLNGDRPFWARGVTQTMANNPSFITDTTTFVGNTPNIISANGSNLVLKDGTPLNSKITYVPYGYAGPATDGGLALVANAGKFNLLSPNSGQTGGTRIALVAGSQTESFYGAIRRQFSPRFQMFLDVALENDSSRWPTNGPGGGTTTISLPASAVTNPFQQAIFAVVPNTYDGDLVTSFQGRRFIGGAIMKLSDSWTAEMDISYGRSSSSFAGPRPGTMLPAGVAAAAAGQVPLLQDTNLYPVSLPFLAAGPNVFTPTPFVTELYDATVRASGPLSFLRLPGGAPRLAGLVEYRKEDIGSGTQYAAPNTFFFPEAKQEIASAYLEATFPIVAASNKIAGVHTLDLQVAVRGDDYTNEGTTTAGLNAPSFKTKRSVSSINPTIAIKYEPIPDFALRASYGEGFLPPTPYQIAPSANTSTSIITVVDPRRGNQVVTLLPGTVIVGGNPAIQPEESTSSSAGFIYSPSALSGFRVSVDYVHIKKTDNIVSSPAPQFIVDNEDIYSNRVTRGAVPPGDSFGVGPIVGLNQSSINVASSIVDAVNGQVDYRRQTDLGTFGFNVGATYLKNVKTQANPDSPEVQNIGIYTFGSVPLKWRINAGIDWAKGPWAAGWNARYYDSYMVANPALPASAALITKQGNGGKVSSQTYHDLYLRYKWEAMDLEFQVGVKNIFDKEPPMDLAFTYSYSLLGDPFGRSYVLSVKKSF